MLLQHFPDLVEMSVVDLGGTVAFWQRAPVRPAHVTIINLFEPGEPGDEKFSLLRADACVARSELEAADMPTSFDLVFSNSVLEHLGGHARRLEFARQVDALATRHWIQTPYRYFPVEPHWLFPAMQFFPVRVRLAVATHWPLAHSRPASREHALHDVLATELLGVTEMKAYFPDSAVVRERYLGMTKSICAVRGSSARGPFA